MRFRAILMDNDGTLMDFKAGEENAIEYTLKYLKINDPAGAQVYIRINEQCWKDFEKGLITQPALRIRRFRELLEHYGLDTAPEEAAAVYEEALSRQAILLPGALEVVKSISEKLPVLILTNGISHIQHGRIDSSPLAPYLSGLLISEEIGSPKPAPDMYMRALEMMGGIRPEEALMIGDSLTSDIRGAVNAGIPACWYNPEHKACPEDIHIDYIIDRMEQMAEVALS